MPLKHMYIPKPFVSMIDVVNEHGPDCDSAGSNAQNNTEMKEPESSIKARRKWKSLQPTDVSGRNANNACKGNFIYCKRIRKAISLHL